MPERVDWHTYFMNIARQVATRATCPRKHVGAVIARDRTILSTGYNGSARGLPHCEDVGCVIEDGHCVSAVHAEANAIIQAARNGVSVAGAELYTTASPCWPCFKLIANAGISRVYYGEFYRDEKSLAVARQAGIELIDLGNKREPGASQPRSRRAKSPEVIEGGGARRGSEAVARDQASDRGRIRPSRSPVRRRRRSRASA